MSILLNDEEIGDAITEAHKGNIRGSDFLDEAKPAARAQLKKVVEWGDEDCKEHKGGGYQRWHCYQCRQALLKEVDDS